jgi:two-component system, HptB-dependent secretion and biofilm response regulator
MRILIVDDDNLNRFLLLHLLEQEGYSDCYEAEDGYEALTLAEKIKPDLILLDVMIPGLDGFQLAPKLKKLAGDIYLPIIFITQQDNKDVLARCLEVGGDDFAAKPYDRVILTAKIRAHARSRMLSMRTHQQNKELIYYQNAVQREHAIVEHIFANALTINEDVKSYFDYRLAPASNFNGDLFLIENSPSGGLYFLVGDFTGHGLAAAIGALPVTRAFQAMTKKGLSVAEMAETINLTLLALLPPDMFFAAALVEIGPCGTHLSVWNGGMPGLIVMDQGGKIVVRFDSAHMALGVLEKEEFENNVARYQAQYGDRLIAYSDGVIELLNPHKQMLGEEGLEKWLQEQPSISIGELNHKIEEFRDSVEQNDDITLVSYTCQPLCGIKHEQPLSQLPFDLAISLNSQQLKAVNPIQDMISLISSLEGIQVVRSNLFTILSELYNNALDHGILKLDSNLKKSTEGFFEYFELRAAKLEQLLQGCISLHINFDPAVRQLKIVVQDSGDGFDHHNISATCSLEASFGRGIPLVSELCSAMQYSEGGRRVDVIITV